MKSQKLWGEAKILMHLSLLVTVFINILTNSSEVF